MKVRFVFAMLMGAMVLVAVDAARQTIYAQEAAGPKQVVDTYELMEILFEDPYELMKMALAEEPADRKAWKVVFDNANRLAEASNLLFFRETSDYEAEAEYKAMAAASRDTAIAIKDAVKAQDYAMAKEKFNAMRESCNACHVKYEEDVAPVLE